MTTTIAIKNQIPEHLRSDAPLFADFVEAYYKYVDQITQAHGQINNIRENTDIDLTDDSFIDDFYAMYGENLPTSIALDKRHFIKILNAIYEASGTENALKLAFQTVFNETVTISYPGDKRLRTSDGIWVREKYITLETKFGSIPDGAITMKFSNSGGDYSFETTRTETIGNTVRLYFQSFTNLEFDTNQRIFHFDSLGTMLYAGDLITSPSFLTILSPGQDWQVGQVFVIPGTVKNTFARVTSVNLSGGVTGVEIVEFGNIHSDGQVSVVSPYPVKPASASIQVESDITSTSPLTYTHRLNVSEYISGLDEIVQGYSDAYTVDSYYLEEYFERGYYGQLVVTQQTFGNSVEASEDTGGLTIEEWLASRATFMYGYGDVVTLRGYYKDELGQLSNQTIRLQDNYYYQDFSYLIETSQDISLYQTILNITHPSGTKRFSDLTKRAAIAVAVDVERTITIEA